MRMKITEILTNDGEKDRNNNTNHKSNNTMTNDDAEVTNNNINHNDIYIRLQIITTEKKETKNRAAESAPSSRRSSRVVSGRGVTSRRLINRLRLL